MSFLALITKIRDDIKVLLLEIYPELTEEINFAHRDYFQEWFVFLYTFYDWEIKKDNIDLHKLEYQPLRMKKIYGKVESYRNLKELGPITTLYAEGHKLFLVDGYHRATVALERSITHIDGVVFFKKENLHPNARKISELFTDPKVMG